MILTIQKSAEWCYIYNCTRWFCILQVETLNGISKSKLGASKVQFRRNIENFSPKSAWREERYGMLNILRSHSRRETYQ